VSFREPEQRVQRHDAELVTDVLAGPGGEVPSHLRRLADGLVSMRRPQSGAG
jgi:hypothetical protein